MFKKNEKKIPLTIDDVPGSKDIPEALAYREPVIDEHGCEILNTTPVSVAVSSHNSLEHFRELMSHRRLPTSNVEHHYGLVEEDDFSDADFADVEFEDLPTEAQASLMQQPTNISPAKEEEGQQQGLTEPPPVDEPPSTGEE